ncbi:MAG: tetratricopeptide repeat protein [Rubripirellula sp.]
MEPNIVFSVQHFFIDHAMSAERKQVMESDSPHANGSDINPMEGGVWRPVRPDELLRKSVPESQDLDDAEPEVEASHKPPKLRLERRQELEHHLKQSPTDLEAFMELGRIYRADNRPIDAKRVFQQAIQIFPEEQELLWEYEEAILSRSLQQLREVTDLVQRLDTVESERELKRCQDDWACRRMEICRARLTRDPSLVHLRVALGEALYDAGMYEAAIDQLEPILENEELSSAAYLISGRCLLAMSKDVEAMAALRAASLRRSVVAPVKTRVLALRLLCETAERMGLALTLTNYREHLHLAEQELAKQVPMTT